MALTIIFLYGEALFTSNPIEEILSTEWLQLPNTRVGEILLEAARPRTVKKYSTELVRFLSKDIPQSPSINAKKFAKIFYSAFMDSLTSMVHLYTTLSIEYSSLKKNKIRVPSPGMGTKESPGHVALRLISLGIQNERILLLLGRDILDKHKTVKTAAKYIRQKFLAACPESDSRQDLDSKFTRVKYDLIQQTQGKPYTRLQVQQPPQLCYPTRIQYPPK